MSCSARASAVLRALRAAPPVTARLSRHCRQDGQLSTGGNLRAFSTSAQPESVDPQATSQQSRSVYGASFVMDTSRMQRRQKEIEQVAFAKDSAGPPPTEEKTNEVATKEQLAKLFRELPGHVSTTIAWQWHVQGKLKPTVDVPRKKDELEEWRNTFLDIYRETFDEYRRFRRSEVSRRRRTRRNFAVNNMGFKEAFESYEVNTEEFGDEHRQKSIVEDCWKAEYYELLHRKAREDIPEREHLAARTDRMADIVAGALRAHYTEQNRPVLTHELADYENPYMMKHSAMERLLQERCVRNRLDERCLPRLMERMPSMAKVRTQAQLPPEVLEPLAAFRGDVRWHFDERERLSQKLEAVSTAFDALEQSGGDAAAVAASLPENSGPPSPDQVPGVYHPWRNHVGFQTAVPRGTAGGINFGKPDSNLDEQILRLRYPTLQRVAHTLPADPKWRAQVSRTIQVLERSKHWDYASKLNAINMMKEVYDSMKSSDTYTRELDKKLVVNRVPSHLKRKYAADKEYIKTFPRKFRPRKSMTWYRPSLTTPKPKITKPKK